MFRGSSSCAGLQPQAQPIAPPQDATAQLDAGEARRGPAFPQTPVPHHSAAGALTGSGGYLGPRDASLRLCGEAAQPRTAVPPVVVRAMSVSDGCGGGGNRPARRSRSQSRERSDDCSHGCRCSEMMLAPKRKQAPLTDTLTRFESEHQARCVGGAKPRPPVRWKALAAS